MDNSDAYANRMIALHWNKPIEGRMATIEQITRKFRVELPQILWRCLQTRAQIAEGFKIPEASTALLNEFLKDSNEVGAWFEERVKYAPDTDWISNTELYESYRVWCGKNGEQAAGKTVFGKRLRRLPAWREGQFLEKKRKRKGEKGSERGFVGLRLVEERGTRVV